MISALKGFNDVLPAGVEPFLDAALWQRMQAASARLFGGHGYRLVWLPLAEPTALFARGLGDETDIVVKEMYSFVDRGGRPMTLRPEGTAGAVRAYIERQLPRHAPQQRWWYMGPMFRAERPQKGRYRQFYQVGAELLGVSGPACEAEMLAMLAAWLGELGVPAQLTLNSLGDADSRAAYLDKLVPFLTEHAEQLCPSCQGRRGRSPLRVLDCKNPACQALLAEAPALADSLSDAARAHVDALAELLAALGVAFVHAPRLVRGLDYYTGLIFEFVSEALGAQDALLGGGRYDHLVEQLGGPATPAVGFAAGVERIALLAAAAREGRASGPALYLAPIEEGCVLAALQLAAETRARGGWAVEVDLAGGRLKQQLRRADRAGARHCLVLGQDELQRGSAALKDLRTGGERPVALSGAALAGALAEA